MPVYDVIRRTHGIDRYEGIEADSQEEALNIVANTSVGCYPSSHEDDDWDEFEIDAIYDE